VAIQLSATTLNEVFIKFFDTLPSITLAGLAAYYNLTPWRASLMTYFIVEAPYEKGFDCFFKTEYGYPNFYRMTELLPTEQKYCQYILLAPNQMCSQEIIDKISEQARTLGFRYVSFGTGLSTTFVFNSEGHLHTSEQFKESLTAAVAHFVLDPPPSSLNNKLVRDATHSPIPATSLPTSAPGTATS